MKYFYTHLIEIESIIIEFDKLDLTTEHKVHLAGLIDSSLHYKILDAILSALSPQDKQVFLHHFKENNHSKIWQFLNDKLDNIEENIKKTADDLKIKLHRDLKEVKNS